MRHNRLLLSSFAPMCAGKRYTIQQTKRQSDYTDRNNAAKQFYHEKEKSSTEQPREKRIFTRRIGSTTYRVSVHFSETSKETLDDKIIRLIKNEGYRKAAGE